MKLLYDSNDIPFFRGHLRSIDKGRERDVRLFSWLLEELEVDTATLPPIIGVVGSKGKGTCVAAASQYLHHYGKEVLSVTSPHYTIARERIRFNGNPVSESTYSHLSQAMARVLRSRPYLLESPAGYLSPVARFLAASCLLATYQPTDHMVVEAGMGGWSDEISMLPIDILAVTSIFEEHLSQLAPTVYDVAFDKMYVGHLPATRSVITGELPESCSGVLRHLRDGGRRVVQAPRLVLGEKSDPFGPANVLVGYAAGREAISHSLARNNFAQTASNLWAKLELPGRNQEIIKSDRTYIVNSAATVDGVVRSIQHAIRVYGRIDTLVLCIPDDKRPQILREHLPDVDVIWAYCENPKFQYSKTSPQSGVEILLSPRLGKTVLVSGVVDFAGEALRMLSNSDDAWPWW